MKLLLRVLPNRTDHGRVVLSRQRSAILLMAVLLLLVPQWALAHVSFSHFAEYWLEQPMLSIISLLGIVLLAWAIVARQPKD